MDIKEGLKYILENSSNYVYVFPREAIDPIIRQNFWDGKGRNPFHFSAPLLGDYPQMLTLLVRKDSRFSGAIQKRFFSLISQVCTFTNIIQKPMIC